MSGRSQTIPKMRPDPITSLLSENTPNENAQVALQNVVKGGRNRIVPSGIDIFSSLTVHDSMAYLGVSKTPALPSCLRLLFFRHPKRHFGPVPALLTYIMSQVGS